MKINNTNGIDIANIYNDNKLQAAKSQKQTGKSEAAGDRVEISRDSMEISRYVEMVKDLPDAENGRIEEIKDGIKNGSYKVSSDRLAAKMLDAIREGKEKA